ncbi:hypothetical protein B0A52_06574 [Exophiala mesophila]|uniref:Fork-head domain-containing protein n=1 Tax=Exophiala mesophila TaxID=212818 RepID=A0A438N1A6_EXOME|nr:hypothetical protein B0A52_06574 [Exophiala mesophila]
MPPTRQPPHFHIHQDRVTVPSNSSPSRNTKPRPQLQPSAMPLQDIHNPPSYATHHSHHSHHSPAMVFSTPMASEHTASPIKNDMQAIMRAENYYANMNYVSIPPPHTAPAVYAGSPIKRAPVPLQQQYRPNPQMLRPQSMFTTFNSNFDPYDQQNLHPASATHENFVDFPEPSYVGKQTLKRSYSDAQVPNARPFKKAKADEDATAEIPAPEDMPPIVDDGNKPNYSYAQMIGMALLRSPTRKLTLSQIYDWISKTFSYYREDTKQSWHNSIRHNLSLHKAFTKKERPKGDAGKGCYWMIEEGMEGQFFKDKNRRGNMSHVLVQPGMTRSESAKVPQPVSDALAPNHFISLPSEPPRPQTAPPLPDLSSDATVPASDPALHENDNETAELDDSVLPTQPKSSPPDAINSSPPMTTSNHHRNISSPTARMQKPLSGPRPRRVLSKVDDSGYFSSIESSAMRPKTAFVLTSELDTEHGRTKREGRAENEIRRLRGSSHDMTPSHIRFMAPAQDGQQSSSPVRVSPNVLVNPMTPAVRFKRPQRPPPSISPNTQLHYHRKAMQDFANSPMKGSGMWVGSGSPFVFPPVVPSSHIDESNFEIFSDPVNVGTPYTPAFSSPLRPADDRITGPRVIVSNALVDTAGNAQKAYSKTPTRSSMLKSSLQASFTGSPFGAPIDSVIKSYEHNDLFDFNSFENDSFDNDEEFDLTQGFGRIGEPSIQSSSTHHVQRPSLGGRSNTSLF